MPQAQPADLTEDTSEGPEAVGDGMHQAGGYASSCDEEEPQVSKAVQELQEEVCHLHDQVWPVLHSYVMYLCHVKQRNATSFPGCT